MHTSRRFSRFAVPAAIAAASLFACTASASAEGVNNNAAQPADQSIFGTQTDVTVGLGATVMPRYMGASSTKVLVLPNLNVQRGIFFADTVRGLGAEYQSASGFYIGQAFNYDAGRTDGNSYWRAGSNRLRGMGDVKGAITSGTTIAQQILPWLSVNAMAEFSLDHHRRGNQYQVGLESVTSTASKNDTFTGDLGAKFGDSQYNQSYFGVTATQSANSGFRAYSAGSGIYAYLLSGTWDHKFDAHWSSQVVLAGTLYTDKASDGPIVERRFTPLLYTALNYSF